MVGNSIGDLDAVLVVEEEGAWGGVLICRQIGGLRKRLSALLS